MRVFGLSRFWLIFRLFERIEVCVFVSRKLNKEAKISKLTLFRAAPATKGLDPEVQWWFYFVCQRVL